MQRPLPKVSIFGGTHGNESTGVALVSHWEQQPDEVQRQNLEVKTILANPRASERTVRYIDHDLNRCFLPEDLSGSRTGYEFIRAREIVSSGGGEDLLSRTVILDLHTTTSNMGPTVILTSLTPFNLMLCAKIKEQLPQLRVITNPLERNDSPFINSLSPFGFCIEVGPVAQGALDPRIIELTRGLIKHTLDVCDDLLAPAGSSKSPPEAPCLAEVEVFEYAETIDYPRHPRGGLKAVVHPERYGHDFVPVEQGSPLFMQWDGQVIPREQPGIYWPIFVGESAYVEKQTAMVLTSRKVLTFSTEEL